MSRVRTCVLVLMLLIVPPPCVMAADSAPKRPERIAVTVYYLLGSLLAIGYAPACAVTFPGFDGPGTDPAERELAKRYKIAALPGAPEEVSEQLAACHPDLIVEGTFKQSQATGRRLASLAPVAWVNTDWERRPTDPSKVWTRWKEIFWNTALVLDGAAPGRAAAVVADLDRRAAALRGHVKGRIFASIDLGSPAAWVVYGPYVNGNGTMPMAVDLEMKSVVVPKSIGYRFSAEQDCIDGAFDREHRPIICASVDLSPELFGILEPADIILNSYGFQPAEFLKDMIRNPLFQSLPAVRAGRFVQTGSWTWSPYGAATVYASVARAFGIDEYFAVPESWDGTRASLAVDQTKGRVCWAVTVRPGHSTPAGPITLGVSDRGADRPLTLVTSPDYLDPDADNAPEDVPPWRRPMRMKLQTGCASLPTSFLTYVSSLDVGYGPGRLERGAPAIGPSAW
ncbi:MAG: ABC transporter substrate-binding protein [Gammaproteobacteria bacterium]